MYEFHYDYMKRKYDCDKLKLCYMDTDSLIYSIKTEDFYKDIAEDVEAIDLILVVTFQIDLFQLERI